MLQLGVSLWSQQAGEAAPSGPPVIASSSFDDSTDIWTVTTDTPSNGNWHWARYANGTTGITADGSGGWSSAPQESGTIAVGASPADLDIPETGTTGTDYEMFLYQRTSGGDDSNVLTVGYTADNTAPVLSSVTLTGGDTIADLDYSTDEGNGTAYWVLTTSATSPTNQQIIDGEDHTGSAAVSSGSAAISTTGAQTQVNFTGLTNGTTYHAHIFHRDDHRNDSSQATDSATPAAAASGPSIEFSNSSQIASATDHSFASVTLAEGKKLVVFTMDNDNDGTANIDPTSPLTFDGNAQTVTQRANYNNGSGAQRTYIGEFDLSGAHAGTGTLVVKQNNARTTDAVVWIIDVDGLTYQDEAGAAVNGDTQTTPLTYQVAVPVGGGYVIAAHSMGGTNATDITWANDHATPDTVEDIYAGTSSTDLASVAIKQSAENATYDVDSGVSGTTSSRRNAAAAVVYS